MPNSYIKIKSQFSSIFYELCDIVRFSTEWDLAVEKFSRYSLISNQRIRVSGKPLFFLLNLAMKLKQFLKTQLIIFCVDSLGNRYYFSLDPKDHPVMYTQTIL